MMFSRKMIVQIAIFVLSIFYSLSAAAYNANKVWFEFRPNGIYRIYVNYTIPALKEFREAYVEFTKKKDAEAFYWDVVRGADFYLPNPKSREFVNPPPEPDPW